MRRPGSASCDAAARGPRCVGRCLPARERPGRRPRTERPRIGRRDRTGGFLMLEALATLLLSGLILLGLASLLSLMAAASDRAAVRAQRMERDGRLAIALRRDLAAALPLRGADGLTIFDGAADRVTFAAAAPGGIVRVTLQASNGGLLRVTSALTDAAAGTAPSMIARQPVRFRFAGRAAPGGAEFVADTWPSGPRMPDAVLVEFGGLVDRVALRASADPGCAAAPDADIACAERPAPEVPR